MLTAYPFEFSRVQRLLQLRHGAQYQRLLLTKEKTSLIAFGFKKGNLFQCDKPAAITVFDEYLAVTLHSVLYA